MTEKLLAILFEEDKESGARSVFDIIESTNDRNGKRRLRRGVLKSLDRTWADDISQIIYEVLSAEGETVTDVTKRFKRI
jgi:hypothetical protein